jgi:MYXO-CTERM domain-containing protein
VQPNASILAAPGGIACSATECATAWSGTSTFGASVPEVWAARFSPSAPTLTVKPDYIARGSANGIVFDGRTFLATLTQKTDLGAARVDLDGHKVGRGMLNGDTFLGVAAVTGGAVILTVNTIDLGGPEASRLHVWGVLDEAPPTSGSGGAGGGGGGSSTGEVVAGGGCACELDERPSGSWSAGLLVAAAALLRRRRQR